jgi:metallo-beta-lactamase class B
MTLSNLSSDQPTSASQVEAHIQNARSLAGADIRPELLTVLCGSRAESVALVAPLMMNPIDTPPSRVFDNLYYRGTTFVGECAITTSDGIILIDAMNTWREAKDLIEGGLSSLGLDASQIKALVVMHGHGDHYGGAKYIQDKYGPTIYMSAEDWEFAPQWLEAWNKSGLPGAETMFGPIPTRDAVMADGQTLTRGDTTIAFYLTPGHTPGTLSAIIPVTDNGTPHRLAFWGGTALPEDLPSKQVYRRSVERFVGILDSTPVDGIITAHPFVDGTLDKIAQLKQRSAGDPHPFVIGPAAVRRYMGVHLECVQAAELR